MKYSVRVIALIIVVALLCTLMVACKEKESDVAAQNAVNQVLEIANGEGATKLWLETDKTSIASIQYIYFKFDEEGSTRTLYAYDIAVNIRKNDTNYNDKHYYVTVLVQDGTYTAKTSSLEKYDLYPKKHDVKKGTIKASVANKMLPEATSKLIAAVAERSARADATARAIEAAERETNTLLGAVDSVIDGVKAAYVANTITAETTREQLGAIVQAIDATFVLDMVDPEPEDENAPETAEEQPAEQQTQQAGMSLNVDTTQVYVFIPARPDAGYLAGTYELVVYTDNYSMTLPVDATDTNIVSKTYVRER